MWCNLAIAVSALCNPNLHTRHICPSMRFCTFRLHRPGQATAGLHHLPTKPPGICIRRCRYVVQPCNSCTGLCNPNLHTRHICPSMAPALCPALRHAPVAQMPATSCTNCAIADRMVPSNSPDFGPIADTFQSFSEIRFQAQSSL